MTLGISRIKLEQFYVAVSRSLPPSPAFVVFSRPKRRWFLVMIMFTNSKIPQFSVCRSVTHPCGSLPSSSALVRAMPSLSPPPIFPHWNWRPRAPLPVFSVPSLTFGLCLFLILCRTCSYALIDTPIELVFCSWPISLSPVLLVFCFFCLSTPCLFLFLLSTLYCHSPPQSCSITSGRTSSFDSGHTSTIIISPSSSSFLRVII